jgi:uncharacterized protein involved in cysteine biosynthesis
MISALTKSISQLFERDLRRVLWKVLLATIAVLIAVWMVVGALLANTTLTEIGWLETVIDWLGGAVGVVVTLILFAPIATMVSGLFQDEVADAVEARHYPDLSPADGQTIVQSLLSGAQLLAWTIVINLVGLLLYIPLAFTVIGTPILFFLINGLLLGREYYEAVALRRMNRTETKAFRRQYRFRLWLAGVLVALVFWVPVLNLAAPIIGTALMVHVVQGLQRRAGAA